MSYYPPQPQGYAPGPGYPPMPQGYFPPQPGYPQVPQGYPPVAGTQGGHPAGPPTSYGYPAYSPAQAPGPGIASAFNEPCSKILLKISARDLSKMDTFSESDPMCVLYLKSVHTGGMLTEIGRTERIKNNPNPDFTVGFELDYYFEEHQELEFKMYDSDSSSAKLDSHDYLGSVQTTIGCIVGSSCGTLVKPLMKSGKVKGQLHVTAEELSSAKGEIELQFRGEHLDKKDFFGKSDPYVHISWVRPNGTFSSIHKTEVIMKTLDPTWKKFAVPLSSFCNGDMDRDLLLEVYDWDSDGGHDLIGSFRTTPNELIGKRNSWDLINMKKMPGGKKHKKGYKNSGVLHKLSGRIIQKPSFFDYLVGGLELSFTVGIDFTGSNGNPALASSLHFINPHAPNQYEHAIQAVGSIIQDYDTDKLFPAMGYGGKVSGKVSHCFALNGNQANPFCTGIVGVIQAYQQAIRTYELWGPTNFAPLINHVAGIAQGSLQGAQRGQVYFVLMIITDGVITDRDATIDAIVAASNLPMSIIIIGVGQADFSDMDVLDGDGTVLRDCRSTPAARDIVQFVPYRNFQGRDDMLAKEVLAELPQQVVQFQTLRGFMPHERAQS